MRSGRPSEYREIVHADACGRFRGVQREYTRTFDDVGRCWLTPDRRVATRWACAGTAAEAVREIRATIGRAHRPPRVGVGLGRGPGLLALGRGGDAAGKVGEVAGLVVEVGERALDGRIAGHEAVRFRPWSTS